ncbi:Uncharacterized protein DAT39_005740 [Clarias magur]|uniref:Uncharacterized protein n=1 Tax=Clarias magur TaxID=1594786 RepID=A0A8J4X7J3_CLAMG|nr:Uncharacterized protein DAT39_005740 [Clarias magur]
MTAPEPKHLEDTYSRVKTGSESIRGNTWCRVRTHHGFNTIIPQLLACFWKVGKTTHAGVRRTRGPLQERPELILTLDG